jgi:hypothetical protein
MNLEYNTQRDKLIISEYGRHIQKMVQHAMTLESKNERQKTAKAIIDMMGELNPHLRDIDDFKHKLWDHLFIISDFKLDVDSPFEKPSIEELFQKPEPLTYPNKKIKFNHYGKVIEMLIDEALKMEDIELKQKLVLAIANQMKKSYVNWNRDSVEDKLILKQLSLLSNEKLSLPEDTELVKATQTQKAPSNNSNWKKKKNNRNRSQHRK